jgi:mono/diheme cytochrome c family protein
MVVMRKQLAVPALLLCMMLFWGVASSIPVQDIKASIERGKIVYQNTCLPCHQLNGSGVPGMNPPLKQTKWVLGDKKKLIRILLDGLNEEIEVNDEKYSNVMPAFNTLSDQEIADVLTYVRNSFGNKASAVTPAEVKKLRTK